ncbi:MAG: Exonuclease SbcD, partial [Bacteroidetes bacterium 38_7]
DDGRRAVIAIAGNHDMPERIEAPNPLAKECGIILLGLPHSIASPFYLSSGLRITASGPGWVQLRIPGVDHLVHLLLTPYANEFRMKTYLGSENQDETLKEILSNNWHANLQEMANYQSVNILMAHLYMISSEDELLEEPLDEEKPILTPGGASPIFIKQLPPNLHYVALGHLHRRHTLEGCAFPVVYCGSPLSYSFSEAFQNKSVEIIEAQPNQTTKHYSVGLTKGKPLIRKKFNSPEEAFQWLPNHMDCLLEMTLHTDMYLNSEILHQFHQLHPAIVQIIPEFSEELKLVENEDLSPSPNAEIIELFKDYFRSIQQVPPDEETLALFREIIANEEDNQ